MQLKLIKLTVLCLVAVTYPLARVQADEVDEVLPPFDVSDTYLPEVDVNIDDDGGVSVEDGAGQGTGFGATSAGSNSGGCLSATESTLPSGQGRAYEFTLPNEDGILYSTFSMQVTWSDGSDDEFDWTEEAKREIQSGAKSGYWRWNCTISLLSNTGATVEFALNRASQLSYGSYVSTVLDRQSSTGIKSPIPLSMSFTSISASPSFELADSDIVAVIHMVINPNGQPTAIKVDQCSDVILARSIEAQVQAWRFKPALRNDIPVAAALTIPVRLNTLTHLNTSKR